MKKPRKASTPRESRWGSEEEGQRYFFLDTLIPFLLHIFLEDKFDRGEMWLGVDAAVFNLTAHVPSKMSEV